MERHQVGDRAATAGRALGPTIGGELGRARFWGLLSGIVAAGLAIRVAYVMAVTRVEDKSLYDSFWYGVTANEFTQRQFFRIPFGSAPTAAHPPMTSMVLGVASFVIGRHRGSTSQRLVMAVLGALVVLCVGLLGRAVAGPWIGLTAAGLAAVVPDFWIPSGIVMSETPAMLLTALTLLAVVRLLRTPVLWSAALVGAACGAVALTRAELILFLPALLIPAVLAARSSSVRRKLALLGTGTLVACLVMAPWVVRNLASFHETTTLSTGEGLALLGANCPQTYSGPDLGSWSLQCAVGPRSGGDESVVSATNQDLALRYAEHHAGRLPLVVLARIGRLWDLYEPIQEAHIEGSEGRPVPASLAGLAVYYLMIPLGIAGVVIFRRYRVRQWFLLVPAGVLTLVSAVVYGLIRFRDPFEVCLAVLAAPPIVLAARAVGHRGGAPAGNGRGPGGSDGQDRSDAPHRTGRSSNGGSLD